jgi:guanylate kinase
MDRCRPPRRGIVFILSGPSGAGKSTIWRAALSSIDGLEASISLTTRAVRSGEADGVDYHFVSEDEFKRGLQRQELAEWAQVFGAYYGTPRGPLDRAVAEGRDILLDIDIQGARQLRRLYPDDAVTILVMTPTFDLLEQRLRRRATESSDAIERRLERAEEEASAYAEYDYLLINDDLDRSLACLGAMIEAERWRVARLQGCLPWKR